MIKLNKHRIKTFIWLVVLASLTGVTLMAARFQSEAVITGIEAEVELLETGNNLILPEDFVAMVTKKFGPMTGLPVDLVDMRSMEDYLKTNPYVRDANVYLGASGKLVLSLHQRLPLMRIVDNNDKHWYIDTDTVLMPVSSHFTARVPLVNGNFPATKNVKQWPVDDLFRIASVLQDNDFMGSLIDQIYVESDEMIWLIPRFGPSKILVGNTEELEDKADRIQRLYKQALPYKGWDTYTYIDTRIAGQIVAKKRLNQ